MVELSEVNDLFLQICPNVEDEWNKHLKWWEGAERGNYNDIAVFVHHTADCYEQNDESCLNNIFSLVENLILNGTEDVRGLMIVGFIETLQTCASNRDYGYKVFESYLGSESRKAWHQIEILWEGKQSLLDVVRFQQAQKSESE